MISSSKFVYTVYIRTSPERIWTAITNPKVALRYWKHANISDWTPGSTWKHVADDSQNTVLIVGEVLKAVPNKLLSLSWIDPADTQEFSCVTFQIENVNDMARLKVTHSNFKVKSKMLDNIKIGWPRVLSSMKSYLETGRALISWD